MNFSRTKSRSNPELPILTRPARRSDTPQVNSLLVEFLKISGKERLAEIMNSIRHGEILVSTAKPGEVGKERIVGFIHGAIHNDPISAGPLLYITALYVTWQYRNMGIGSSLLDSIIERAVKRHAIRGVEIGTARRYAPKFYKKRGFRQFQADFGEKLLSLDIRTCEGSHRKEVRGSCLVQP